jgi:MoxR-like ATPase
VEALQAVTSPEELLELRALVAAQRLDDTVADYVVRLAQATRAHGDIERGASTRAVLALGMAARAHALWESRDFVTPGDVRAVLGPCLAHRLLLRSANQGAYTRDEAAHLLEEVARKVPAPR